MLLQHESENMNSYVAQYLGKNLFIIYTPSILATWVKIFIGNGKKTIIPSAEKKTATFSPYLALSSQPIVYHIPIYTTKMTTPIKKASTPILSITYI